MIKLIERLYRLLPDKCEMAGCTRHGVRGYENRVDGRLMCDDCHALWLKISDLDSRYKNDPELHELYDVWHKGKKR